MLMSARIGARCGFANSAGIIHRRFDAHLTSAGFPGWNYYNAAACRNKTIHPVPASSGAVCQFTVAAWQIVKRRMTRTPAVMAAPGSDGPRPVTGLSTTHPKGWQGCMAFFHFKRRRCFPTVCLLTVAGNGNWPALRIFFSNGARNSTRFTPTAAD